MRDVVLALTLSAGYNTALVTVGAAILGASAGAIGTFVLLRKRSLVSDAASHATLPGLALAFIVMSLLLGDGRHIVGLMFGAALTSWIGMLSVEWITRRTRLTEDAAIGSVLSVFFGFGVVLLTVVQTLETGRQAGISTYLLGSTAGMLMSEAQIIAVAAFLTGAAVFVLRRPFTMVCFDPAYAATRGLNIRRTDLLMMAILLAVMVIGLRVVGLVLIVALAIIPPATARLWTNRPERMIIIAAGIGAVSAYVGAVISSLDRDLPTGALIVLTAFALFVISLFVSPVRGVMAERIRRFALREAVHRRQGLLSLARDEPIFDRLTIKVLGRAGFIRPDGVPTRAGRAAAAEAVREEALWRIFDRLYPADTGREDGFRLTPIRDALPADLVDDLERKLRVEGKAM